MDVHLDNPDLQIQIDHWVEKTGRPADELVQDAMAGYFDELKTVRAMLDSRYDNIESGKMELIDGEEAYARLMKKTEASRERTV